MKYLAWTLLVWLPITGLAAGIASQPTDSPQIGTAFIVVLIVLVGLPIYVIGLIAMWWRDMGRWSR
jgi:hypothetical protein